MKAGPQSEPPAVEIGENILLTFPLLGMEGRHEFPGRIRRVTRDGEELGMGVEFEELPPGIFKKIEDYVATINQY